MIAAVVFDAPLGRAFDYQVPDGWPVAPGQRVRAPLAGALRTGLVVATRAGAPDGLKTLQAVVDRVPLLGPHDLDLVLWIARRSLSSPGSTAAGLLPPPLSENARGRAGGITARPLSPPSPAERGAMQVPDLYTGAGRERRLLADLSDSRAGGVLVIVADIEAAARWAQRLAKTEPVVRLDSGVSERERARAWAALADGRVRVAVGTRSALLAPVTPPATLALVDEHEAAHMPPGHPRIHARDVLLERARRERARLVLTTATPSVEMWWRASSGRARRVVAADAGPWPSVTIADTRGILRREPVTPELARALRETVAHGGRAFLAVSRYASALACEECGLVVRCPACGLALAYSRAARRLTCRVCRASLAPAETCPECRGRRLSAFGWGVERVEQAVQRRLPRARIVRYEPDARGRRARVERTAAARADVVIGTRGALRLFGPASLALAGFVSPDQLLRVPDFRAGERLLAFLWAAAERVGPRGQLIVQSQNPLHHAFAALAGQAVERFYEPELSFRAELGYPPFRRLALVTVRPRRPDDAGLGVLLGMALRDAPDVTVYPPSPLAKGRGERIVVKGGDDLSDVLAEAIRTVERASGRDSRGIMDVEVDPVEWPS